MLFILVGMDMSKLHSDYAHLTTEKNYNVFRGGPSSKVHYTAAVSKTRFSLKFTA